MRLVLPPLVVPPLVLLSWLYRHYSVPPTVRPGLRARSAHFGRSCPARGEGAANLDTFTDTR
jgi:hypothetical protein